MGGAASCCEAERDFPVKVHVYDLAPDGGSAVLGALTGGGGVYHSGVEVGGVEYAFGDKSGVWTQQPARLPASFGAPAAYKRAEDCGVARLAPSALRRIVRRRRAEWPASRYQLVTCNCNHFTAAACAALGGAQPPAYLNQLAEAGSQAASMVAGLGMLAAGFLDAAAQQAEAHDAAARRPSGQRVYPLQ